jgi:hypothetical protein
MSSRKLRTGLVALLFFTAFGFLGLLLGFGRGGVSAGALGGEVCRATCVVRGWQGGALVRPEESANANGLGPKTCQCR